MLDTLLPRKSFTSYDDFFTHYRLNTPPDFNFAFDIVDRIAAQDPGRPALVWCDDTGAELTLTMRQIAEESTRTAHWLRTLGIAKGDAVMLMLKRRHEYWPTLLALHRLGAIAIPATTQLMKKDVAYRIKAAGVKMIISVDEPSIRAAVEEAMQEAPVPLRALVPSKGLAFPPAADLTTWLNLPQSVATAPASFERPPTAATDPMLLYFTSGTTGLPKMVLHDFAYPLGHIVTALYWHGCRPGGLHLTVAETGWAKAAWGKIYGQWLAGSAVMVYDFDRFSAPDLLRVVEKYRVTTFCAPPTMYRYFIKEDLTRYNLSAITRATVAGEPLNPEVYQQFKAATGLELAEGYGQTELTVIIGTFPWMTPKPGSMGRPAPGYDLALVDEAGRPCEAGEEGQIVIRTATSKPAGMFLGYHKDPDLTAKAWHDDVYYTGDVAWRDEDGYYWFVGRVDDVIKSSGYRIGPFEVESALIEHPAVLECAVTGVPDPDRGAIVKATIVLAKGRQPSEALKKELQEHVKHTTAPYKYPRIIEFAETLPKTISGKIRRVEIRKQNQQ